MSEEFVTKLEFEDFKNEVRANRKDDNKLLTEIDKKVDIIFEKIVNADDKENLKLQPIKESISKLEDNQKWLWRSVGATIIGLIFKFWIG